MMMKLVRSPVNAEITAAASRIAEPARGSLRGAETVSAGAELPLEIGERDLPEFPFGLTIRCHRQPFWSFDLLVGSAVSQFAPAGILGAHESPCTTKLYDRTRDEITLDEVERIPIQRLPCPLSGIWTGPKSGGKI